MKRDEDRGWPRDGRGPKGPAGSYLKTKRIFAEGMEPRASILDLRGSPLLSVPSPSPASALFLSSRSAAGYPEDHWKLIGLYRVTAQKGGE